MTDEHRRLFLAFGAGVAVGIGSYAAIRHWRTSRADNMIPARPIPKELLIQPCKGGVYFGNAPPGKCPKTGKQYLMYCGKPADKDGNILVLGGPGSGKTTGVVYPSFGTWPGSIVMLDCKGGAVKTWQATHQNSDKKLCVTAPYQKNGGPCAYDPFAIVRKDPDHAPEHFWDLAENLIPLSLSEQNPVWVKNAQNVLAGALLHYYDAGTSFIEAIQAINGRSVSELVNLIDKGGNEKARAFVSKIFGASGRTMASIGVEMNEIPRLAMNQEIMDFLTPAPDRPTLDWGNFNVQREAFDVILDVPGNMLKLHCPLIRLMITQLLKTLSLRREKTYMEQDLPSVLIMLDEFPQLGNFSVVVDALATLRSKGAALLLCTQSLAYLDAIYGKDMARTILGNCPFKVIFGETDTESQARLSALIGGADTVSGSVSFNPIPGIAFGTQRRPLVYPEELGHLKNPIIISPYGVCEAEKGHLYPPHTELPLRSESVSRQGVTEKSSQQEEPLCTKDSPAEEAGGSNGTVDAERETMLDSVCDYCAVPRSAKEIVEHFNVNRRSQFQAVYLKPLLEQGRLQRLYPDKPRHPEQKYESTAKPACTPNALSAHKLSQEK